MLINTGNISRKVLSKVLRSFVKNFERLQRACFVEIRDYKELIVGHRGVVLSSSPILFFAKYRKGWYHFYGDLRKNYEENAMRKFCEQISDITGQSHNMLNVGVMQEWMDYRPRTFHELERKLQELYRKNRRKSA